MVSHGCEIVTAIIAMAHKLGLQVVAEGVESQAQVDFLTANQCDEIQGYHFARPEDATATAKQLASGSASRVEMMRMMNIAKSNSKLIAA